VEMNVAALRIWSKERKPKCWPGGRQCISQQKKKVRISKIIMSTNASTNSPYAKKKAKKQAVKTEEWKRRFTFDG